MSDSASPTPRQRHHKRLARRLVEAVGGVDAASLFCRVGKSQLSDYGNPNVAGFMPADVIDDLEQVAGRPLYTAGLAALQGHVLIALPAVEDGADGLMRSVVELAAELGDVAEAVSRALADRNVSPAEARAALDQKADLDRASALLGRKLEALLDPEGK